MKNHSKIFNVLKESFSSNREAFQTLCEAKADFNKTRENLCKDITDEILALDLSEEVRTFLMTKIGSPRKKIILLYDMIDRSTILSFTPRGREWYVGFPYWRIVKSGDKKGLEAFFKNLNEELEGYAKVSHTYRGLRQNMHIAIHFKEPEKEEPVEPKET